MYALKIHIPAALKFTSETYELLAHANRDLRMELTADGELIIMPPTGGISGRRNADLIYQVQAWNRQAKLGIVFDSSTEFKLPNGAYRCPDAAWISHARWNGLTLSEQETFPPICPDFVIELRSKTDSLKDLRAKMQEYIDNGCQLGWLLDPKEQQVEVYRPNQAVMLLKAPESIAGDPILPGFALDLAPILK